MVRVDSRARLSGFTTRNVSIEIKKGTAKQGSKERVKGMDLCGSDGSTTK